MSTWTVPVSSSPQAPSTPGSDRRRTGVSVKSPNGVTKNTYAPNPSTTPAGPPPSSVRSFTPADPPPSSIFGSSQLGSGRTLFKSRANAGANAGSRKNANALPTGNIDGRKLARFLDKSGNFDFGHSNDAPTRNTFGVPNGSSSIGQHESDGDEADSDDEGGTDEEDFEEDDVAEASEEEYTMDLGPESNDRSLNLGSSISSLPNGSLAKGKQVAFGSSILDDSPRGVKRSRGASAISNTTYRSPKRPSKPRQESAIPSIAKSMVAQHRIAELKESDQFVLGTEDILQQELFSAQVSAEAHDHRLETALSRASERLSNFWRSSDDHDMRRRPSNQDTVMGIGPGRDVASVHKATFLGAILLQLHHPPEAKGKQAFASRRLGRSSMELRMAPRPSNPTAIPKVLTDWINRCHDPYESFNVDVQKFRPNPTAHVNYWDILFSLLLRGKFADVIQLLKTSDFRHAKTAREDRKDEIGYSSAQINNVERVINRAIQVLGYCPALQDEDWHVTGNSWVIFRKRIEQEMNDLATFAEGRDRDLDPADNNFEASNFGLRSTTMGLSQSARKAESQVPWTIYQNLRAMYGMLLGGTTEILAMAHDWVEATIGLTIWWTGNEDEDMAVGSVALTRRSLRHSDEERLVDVNPIPAYLRRLATAFQSVIDGNSDEQEFSIDTLNSVEVGLASIFEGNVEGVMGLLRMWSLPVALACAEVAHEGGWFESAAGTDILHGLDQGDLLLMSGFEPRTQHLSKDSILAEYAEALSNRECVHNMQVGTMREGWELSMSMLARLDDEGLAAKSVKDLLDRLPLDTDDRMDKILRTCEQFNIPEQAREKTEVALLIFPCQAHANHFIGVR